MNEQQRKDLVDEIYDWIMSNDEMGMGEMGDALYEAEQIVHKWERRTVKPDLNERYNDLVMEATDELYRLVDGEIVLTDDDHELYDMPYTYWVGKHNAFSEYGIIKVYKAEAGQIVFVGDCFDDEEIKEFTLMDVNLSTVIDVISRIKQVKK